LNVRTRVENIGPYRLWIHDYGNSVSFGITRRVENRKEYLYSDSAKSTQDARDKAQDAVNQFYSLANREA
jgi:hypothetical protein